MPGLIFFEFQASQSRRYKERRSDAAVFRHAPLFITNTELYHVTEQFLAKVWQLGLYERFSNLKGADLLYACMAHVEDIPLVTHDADFDRYSDELRLIKPREMYKQ